MAGSPQNVLYDLQNKYNVDTQNVRTDIVSTNEAYAASHPVNPTNYLVPETPRARLLRELQSPSGISWRASQLADSYDSTKTGKFFSSNDKAIGKYYEPKYVGEAKAAAKTASKRKKYLEAEQALNTIETNLAYATDPLTESQLRSEYNVAKQTLDAAKAEYETAKQASTSTPNYIDTVQVAENADTGKVSEKRTAYETAQKAYDELLAQKTSGYTSPELIKARKELDKAKAEYEMYATTPEQAQRYERMNAFDRGVARTTKAVGSAINRLIPTVSTAIGKAGTAAAESLDYITTNLDLTTDNRVAYAYANNVDYTLNPGHDWKPNVQSIDQAQFDNMPENVKNRFATVDDFNRALADANYKLQPQGASEMSRQKLESIIEDTKPMYERSKRLAQESTTGTYGLAKFGLELIPSSVEMAADIAVSRLTGVNGLANMGARVFGGSYLDAKDQGADEATATLYGILNMAVEVGSEMIGGESIVNRLAYQNNGVFSEGIEKAIAKIGDKGTQKLALWAVGGIEEGLEEVMSEAAQPLLEALLASDFGEALRQNYSEQRVTDYLKAALGGALMSIAGGGAADFMSGSINSMRGNGFNTVTENRLADINRNYQLENSEQARQKVNNLIAQGYSEQGAANQVKNEAKAQARMGVDIYNELTKERSPEQRRADEKTFNKYARVFENADVGDVVADVNDHRLGTVEEKTQSGIVIQMDGGERIAVPFFEGQGLLDSNSSLAQILANDGDIIAPEYVVAEEAPTQGKVSENEFEAGEGLPSGMANPLGIDYAEQQKQPEKSKPEPREVKEREPVSEADEADYDKMRAEDNRPSDLVEKAPSQKTASEGSQSASAEKGKSVPVEEQKSAQPPNDRLNRGSEAEKSKPNRQRNLTNKIDSFRGENSFLSNMFDTPVTFEGKTYRSAEAAFQAAKTLNSEERDRFTRMSGKEAKAAGRNVKLRSDWNSARIGIMKQILQSKFAAGSKLAQQLLATGNANLVEGNTWGDTFWGSVNGVGQNNLGRILMEIRADLQKSQNESQSQQNLTTDENETESHTTSIGNIDYVSDPDAASVSNIDKSKKASELDEERFTPDEVNSMTAEDVVNRLKSWAKNLKLGGLKGFAQKIGAIATAIRDTSGRNAQVEQSYGDVRSARGTVRNGKVNKRIIRNDFTNQNNLDRDAWEASQSKEGLTENRENSAFMYLLEQDANRKLSEALDEIVKQEPALLQPAAEFILNSLFKRAGLDMDTATVADGITALANSGNIDIAEVLGLDEEDIAEIFALLDRASKIEVSFNGGKYQTLNEILDGNVELTTTNDENATEADFHGEAAYKEQIHNINIDLSNLWAEWNQLNSMGNLSKENQARIPIIEAQIERLENQKAQLKEQEEKIEKGNRDNQTERDVFDTEEELKDYAKRESENTPERPKVKTNGQSFIKASDMPAEHKSGSGGRVRGININGETYYAVADAEKGGYKNIAPDADVKAAKAVIDAIEKAEKKNRETAQYYMAMANRGETLTRSQEKILQKAEQAALDLREKLDRIRNGNYTIQDLWNDGSIPKDIKRLGPQNDTIRGRSLNAIANAVTETDARRGIEEMLVEGATNGKSSVQPGTRENGGFGLFNGNPEEDQRTRSGVSRNDGQGTTREIGSGAEQTSGTAESNPEGERNVEGRNEDLGLQRQSSRTQEGREALSQKLTADADASAKKASGNAATFRQEMQNLGHEAETYTYMGNDDIVTYDKATARPLNENNRSPSTKRLRDKLSNRSDIEITFVDSLYDYMDGDLNNVNGIHVHKDGRQHIFATDIQSAAHESSHEDLDRMAPDFNGVGDYWTPEEYVEGEIEKALTEKKFDIETLRNVLRKGYTEEELGKEMYCELSACVETGMQSKFGKEFDEAAKLLKDSETFKNLLADVYNRSDNTTSAQNQNKPSRQKDFQPKTGNSQTGVIEDFGVNKTDDLWGTPAEKSNQKYTQQDIELGNRLIEEAYANDPERAKIKPAGWFQTLSIKPDEDTYIRNRELMRERAETKPTGADIYGSESHPEHWQNMQKADKRMDKLGRRTIGNQERMDKITGNSNAGRAVTDAFKAINSMMKNVMDGSKSITEFYHLLQNYRGKGGIGQVVDERISNLAQTAAMLEQAASVPTAPEEMKEAAKAAAARLFSALANNADRVNRVQYEQMYKLTQALEKNAKASKDSTNLFVRFQQWKNRMQISGSNFWRMVDGFNRGNGIGYQMKNAHERAINRQIKTQAEALAHFANVKADKGYMEFATGKAKGKIDSMINEVTLKMMLDSLATEDSKGGLHFDEAAKQNGFTFEDAKGNQRHMEIEGETAKEKEAFINDLYQTLVADVEGNSAAKAYAKAASDMFYSMKGDLESVFEAENGYSRKFYGEGKYFPIRYNDNPTAKKAGTDGWTFSNLMSRTGTEGKVYRIVPASKVVDSYISQASNYIAFSELGTDLKLMTNPEGALGSLTDAVSKNFGKTWGDWLTKYTRDMNQIREEDLTGTKKKLAKSRQLMMQGALVGSLSVPVKQVSSLWSAIGVVDPKAIAAVGLTHPIVRSNTKGINNPFMLSRKQGSIDPDVSAALEQGVVGWLKNHSKVASTVINATNIMDSRTVASVYKACVLDVEWNSDLGKGIYKNGKDLSDGLTSAGEFLVDTKFENAVLNTQPIFTKQARNELARTDDEFLKMFSTFRTQQTQNWNRMLTTTEEYKAAKRNGGDTATTGKALRQTIAGQIAANVSLSALTILADGLKHKLKKYKDDDDKLDPEKIMERFWKNAVEGAAGTTLFGDQIAKIIIDAVEGKTFDKYADKEFFGVSAGSIGSAITTLKYWGLLADDIINNNGKHMLNFGKLAINNTATLLGVPLGNAYTIGNSIVQFYKDIAGEGSREYEDLTKAWDAIRTDYGNILYNGIESGNEKAINKVTNYLMRNAEKSAAADGEIEEGEVQRKYEDALLALVQRTGFERLKDGTGDEDDFANALMTFGGLTENEADAYIQKRKMELDETNTNGIKYTSMKKAWMNGELDDDQVVRYLQEYGGKDEPTAKRTLESYKKDKAIADMFGDVNDVYNNDVNAYSELGQAYNNGKIDREQYKTALKEIGGMSEEDAELKVLDWDCKTEYGYKLSDMGTAYNDGMVSAAEYKDALVKYGKKSDASIKSSIMSHLDSQYEDGKITRQQAINDYTKYTTATKEQATVHFNKQDFRHKYGESYSNKVLKNMLADKKITERQALDWYMKCNDDATDKKANNWLERTKFENLTGYEAQWSYSSDLYDTYETKPKKGLMTFYDEYGKQFKSAKSFGKVFTTLNDDTRSYPEYHNLNGYDATDNQRRVITQMNKLIKSGEISYDLAYTIWTEHYGWKANARNAWGHVQRS